MWLRNWDNIQIAKYINKPETVSVFQDKYYGIMDTKGNIHLFNEDSAETVDSGILYGKLNQWTAGTYYRCIMRAGNFCLSNSVQNWDSSNNLKDYEDKGQITDESNIFSQSPILLVGSGSATEQYNDYFISDFHSSTIINDDFPIIKLTHVGYNIGSLVFDYNKKEVSYYISRTFKNNNNESITAKELGILFPYNYCFFVGNAGYHTLINSRILVYRETITPVTFQPGDSHTFTIQIKIPLNNS